MEIQLEIVKALKAKGAKHVVLVGGAVRDLEFLSIHGTKIKSKDLDFEVYGLSAEDVGEVLGKFGQVTECGQSFGVFKLRTDCGSDFDFSLPRRDSKVAPGHQGFVVDTDPNMTIEEACRRRNFTMNALAMNVETGELYDFFDGQKHIQHKLLKVTDPEHYSEDPLRNLIALQMCVRYGLNLWGADLPAYEKAGDEFHTISEMRVWLEWEKLFTKGIEFNSFFRKLGLLCLDGHYPELNAMYKLRQDPEWHPEGPACTHSELAATWTANYCIENGIEGEDRLVLVCAALLHDLGKPMTTTRDDDGRIRAKGHPEAAVDVAGPATKFFEKINMPLHLRARIAPLIKEHMIHLGGSLSKAGVRRLARRLDPATIYELDVIIQADHASRPPLDASHPCPDLVNMAVELEIANSKPKPLLLGRHLIPLGVKPGPEMGKILKNAFERQLDGDFETVEEGLKVLKFGG